jgi:hypothetical protein
MQTERDSSHGSRCAGALANTTTSGLNVKEWLQLDIRHLREVFHGWRAGLARRVVKLRYLRRVQVDEKTGEQVLFNETARYFLGKSVEHDVLVVHYVGIDPEVLAAIAEFRNSDEVEREVRTRCAREERADLDVLDEDDEVIVAEPVRA